MLWAGNSTKACHPAKKRDFEGNDRDRICLGCRDQALPQSEALHGSDGEILKKNPESEGEQKVSEHFGVQLLPEERPSEGKEEPFPNRVRLQATQYS